MKKVRFYLDKDEEQVWIQEMANKGWALKSFCLGVYTFEPCEAGEYIYQIDLLDNWNGDKRNFADFMSEMDVEVVSQWYRSGIAGSFLEKGQKMGLLKCIQI